MHAAVANPQHSAAFRSIFACTCASSQMVPRACQIVASAVSLGLATCRQLQRGCSTCSSRRLAVLEVVIVLVYASCNCISGLCTVELVPNLEARVIELFLQVARRPAGPFGGGNEGSDESDEDDFPVGAGREPTVVSSMPRHMHSSLAAPAQRTRAHHKSMDILHQPVRHHSTHSASPHLRTIVTSHY